jgi:hypothetical protein
MTIPQKVAQRMGTSKRSNADVSIGMPPRDIGLISDSRPSLYPPAIPARQRRGIKQFLHQHLEPRIPAVFRALSRELPNFVRNPPGAEGAFAPIGDIGSVEPSARLQFLEQCDGATPGRLIDGDGTHPERPGPGNDTAAWFHTEQWQGRARQDHLSSL